MSIKFMDSQSDNQEIKKPVFQIILPPKVPISIFPPKLQTDNVPSSIIDPLKQIHFILNTSFSNFDLKQSHKFNFKFPASVFPDSNGRSPLIDFLQKMSVQEDTFSSTLASEQYQQIKKDGTFLVKSNLSTMPYKWKIHPFVFKGYQVRQFDWHVNLSRAYHQLRQIGKRLNGQTLSIRLNLNQLAYYPPRIANMLVGLRQMKVHLSPDYDRILEIQFLLSKFNKFYNETPNALYQHLYIPLDGKNSNTNKISTLKKIDSNFEKNWQKIQRRKIQQYQKAVQDPNQKQFQQILTKQKREAYNNHLQSNLQKDIYENVFDLLRMFTIFTVLSSKKQQDIALSRQKIQNNLKKNHKIRSKSHYFMQQTMEKEMAPILKNIQLQYQRDLAQKLDSKIYNQYLEFARTYKQRKQQLEQKVPIVYAPSRTFQSFYHVFPPYRIIQTPNYRGQINYSLEKTINTEISTDHNFWKFSLYKMRIYNWSKNCFFFLVALAWVGPLGLKQLTTFGKYVRDQNVNYNTGEMYYIYSKSLYLQFQDVLQGIKESRERFERLPDTGFFGKNITRALNYIQCYIFRFLIVGVILLLIVKPIVILIYCVLSFGLILTQWIWLPLTIVVTYLFNVLIYQFEIDDQRRGFYRFSERLFPLINTPLMLVFNLLRVAIYIISILIIHPLGIIFWILFASIARLYRILGDNIMFLVFKCLARVPARDTAIAWKVSGPTVSRNYYLSMSQEDVYILVQSNLEMTYLQQFSKTIRSSINQPLEDIKRVVNGTFKQFSCYFECPSEVRQVNQKLLNQFENQLGTYKRRFPYVNASNLRFTKSQIEVYFENSVKLVTNFIQKNNADWLCSRQNCDTIQQYTKNLWRRAFNYEILEPLESLDERFELKKQNRENSAKKMIMRALEGQVNLQRLSPSVTRQLKTFSINYICIVTLSVIIDKIVSQCSQYPCHSIDRAEFCLVFNRNIREVIAKDRKNKRYDRYYQGGQVLQIKNPGSKSIELTVY